MFWCVVGGITAVEMTTEWLYSWFPFYYVRTHIGLAGVHMLTDLHLCRRSRLSSFCFSLSPKLRYVRADHVRSPAYSP
jgi:hypothetical protein